MARTGKRRRGGSGKGSPPDKETWRWVVGYEGRYKVSSHGRVYSVRRVVNSSYGATRTVRGRILRQGGGAYPWVGLRDGKRCDTFNVHILVATAFYGPCPTSMECRHLDGNNWNNRVDNLCWGTPKQNAEDKFRHGTVVMGEDHPASKLNPEKIRRLRSMYTTGYYTQSDLAGIFQIHQVTVSEIVLRKIWRHVA